MIELHIEPLCKTTDLLLGIGLILLGLCILAIIITVEICYFRNPKYIKEYYRKEREKHGKTVQQSARPDRKHWIDARRVCFGPLPGMPRGRAERKHIQLAAEQ